MNHSMSGCNLGEGGGTFKGWGPAPLGRRYIIIQESAIYSTIYSQYF